MSRKQIDWEALEVQYRAGIRSLKNIGAEFGVSDAAIVKRAKRDSWVRDLNAKIMAKADAKVSASLVSAPVSARTKILERDVIEAGATQVAEVKLSHRKDIHRARKLTTALLDELERQTDPETLVLLEELGELLRNEDDKGQDRRNDLYQKVISLSERSKTMKTLAESLQKTVDMERTAFNMDKDTSKEADPLAALLTRIAGSNGNGFKPVATDPERGSAFVPQPAGDDETD